MSRSAVCPRNRLPRRSRSVRRGHARQRALSVGAAFADEKPRAHRALPLHLDRSARLAGELVADELVGRVAQVDPPRHAVRLHPARRVHRIAPDVEHELPQADDPADAGPAIHADPEVDAVLARRVELVEVGADTQGHAGHRLGVIRAPPRNSRDAHVVVADSADLLDAVLLREKVKTGEDPVEERNELLRVEPLGEHRGSDDVRVEHRRVLVRVGDRALTGLEPGRDLFGQHVQKEQLGAFLLACERVHGANAMIAPSRMSAYRNGTYPTGEPKMRYRLPHTTAIGRINTEVRTSSTLPCRVCSSSRGSAPTAANRASTAFDMIWARRIIPGKVMSLAASPSPRRTDSVDHGSGRSGKRQPLAVRYIEARARFDVVQPGTFVLTPRRRG